MQSFPFGNMKLSPEEMKQVEIKRKLSYFIGRTFLEDA